MWQCYQCITFQFENNVVKRPYNDEQPKAKRDGIKSEKHTKREARFMLYLRRLGQSRKTRPRPRRRMEKKLNNESYAIAGIEILRSVAVICKTMMIAQQNICCVSLNVSAVHYDALEKCINSEFMCLTSSHKSRNRIVSLNSSTCHPYNWWKTIDGQLCEKQLQTTKEIGVYTRYIRQIGSVRAMQSVRSQLWNVANKKRLAQN